MKIFGREPALWLAAISALIQVVSTFVWSLTDTQQATLNAAAAGVAGLITAIMVHDGVKAAVLGLIQAILALGIGFGWHLTPINQSVIMSAVAAVLALWVWDRVVAPVAPDGSRTR